MDNKDKCEDCHFFDPRDRLCILCEKKLPKNHKTCKGFEHYKSILDGVLREVLMEGHDDTT